MWSQAHLVARRLGLGLGLARRGGALLLSPRHVQRDARRHLARVLPLVGKVEGLGELRVEDAARGEVIPQEDTRLAKRVVPGQAIVVVQPEPERA